MAAPMAAASASIEATAGPVQEACRDASRAANRSARGSARRASRGRPGTTSRGWRHAAPRPRAWSRRGSAPRRRSMRRSRDDGARRRGDRSAERGSQAAWRSGGAYWRVARVGRRAARTAGQRDARSGTGAEGDRADLGGEGDPQRPGRAIGVACQVVDDVHCEHQTGGEAEHAAEQAEDQAVGEEDGPPAGVAPLTARRPTSRRRVRAPIANGRRR